MLPFVSALDLIRMTKPNYVMCLLSVISYYSRWNLHNDYSYVLWQSLCRKSSYSPHRRDWNFLGGGGFCRPKNLKTFMKLNWNFQRGGGGIDIFWNYTLV